MYESNVVTESAVSSAVVYFRWIVMSSGLFVLLAYFFIFLFFLGFLLEVLVFLDFHPLFKRIFILDSFNY
jgi:hypothetical protein